MAESLVYRLVKNVELNRRALIANCRDKGKAVNDDASLNEVVAINNSIQQGQSENQAKYEVRFFDADGSQIGDSQWVEYGGGVTPPENPNLDPERLEFERWYSIIGNNFDNITHDVDYGAKYKIKNQNISIFCEFTPYTGLSVKIPIRSYYTQGTDTKTANYTIDWGDGSETENHLVNTSGTTTFTFNHTYTSYGNYVITISCDKQFDIDKIGNVYEFYWSLNTSSTAGVLGPHQSTINNAIKHMYIPVIYSDFFSNRDALLDYIITDCFSSYNSWDCVEYTKFIIWPNKVGDYPSGGNKVRVTNTEHIIFDYDWDYSTSLTLTFSNMYKIDKLIIPVLKDFRTSGNYQFSIDSISGFYRDCKIISKEDINISSECSSLILLGDHITTLNTLTNGSLLSELIFPNSITNINEYALRYSRIQSIQVPENCNVNPQAFRTANSLKWLLLPLNFNQSLNLTNTSLVLECLIDILNKVQDLSDTTSQTLSFNALQYDNILNNTFVKKVVDIYEISDDYQSEETISLIEAFNSKNWTIAI